MSDTVVIEGEEFISSKRASKETGYAQDYIGQLARGGLITAKRMGGLWYVSRSSLRDYKAKADEYIPRPPAPPLTPDMEATVSFDGKDFVSAARAAKLTGYHPDYIGQLARSGKIGSRQVGNRWFVDRDGIDKHKKQKDALLAAVQIESVGLASTARHEHAQAPMEAGALSGRAGAEPAGASVHGDGPEPFFTYTQDATGDLLPETSSFHVPQAVAVNHREYLGWRPEGGDGTSIPIRRVAPTAGSRPRVQPERRRGWQALHLLAGAALTIVIVLTFGFTSFRDKAIYALSSFRSLPQNAAAGQAGDVLQRAIEWVESLFAHDIEYKGPRE